VIKDKQRLASVQLVVAIANKLLLETSSLKTMLINLKRKKDE
jgi:hypothetical protein